MSEHEYEIIESAKVQIFSPKVVVADVLSAITIGCCVAIPISIIDYAIMAKVAGVVPSMGHQVKAGLACLVKQPQHFFLYDTPTTKYSTIFKLCVGVYGGTYVLANTTRSFTEGYQKDASAESVAFKCGVTSSAVNIALTIWKDSNILRVMPKNPAANAATAAGTAAAGTAAGKAATETAKAATEKVFVPMLSRLGFAVRDMATCVAAFTVVPLLKDYLHHTYPEQISVRQAYTIASLVTPSSIQFVTTGIHIPSIIYQRMYRPDRRWSGPEGYATGIMNALRKDYTGALRMRIVRIFVAFGIGGIGNAELRPRVLKVFEPQVFQIRKLKNQVDTQVSK